MLALLALACSTSTPIPDAPRTAAPAEAPEDDGKILVGKDLMNWVSGKRFHSPLVFLEFTSPERVVMTWNRMKGDPVVGKVRPTEKGFEVRWDSDATNTLNQIYRMEMRSRCTLALVYQKRKNNQEITDPVTFVDQGEACSSAVESPE